MDKALTLPFVDASFVECQTGGPRASKNRAASWGAALPICSLVSAEWETSSSKLRRSTATIVPKVGPSLRRHGTASRR